MTDTQNNEATAPSLAIQDLRVIRTAIEIASQRGAFRATEFSTVGAVYNKLIGFLDSFAPEAAEATPDDSTESGEYL